MNVLVKCPSCGKGANVPQEHLGKRAQCPKCRNRFVLASLSTVTTAPPVASQRAPLIVAELIDESPPPPPMMPATATGRVVAELVENRDALAGSLLDQTRADTRPIESYSVVYRGGHPDYVKEKAGSIEFKVFSDRFELLPTLGTKRWFRGLVIPFARTSRLEIVERQLGSVEGILGGLNSRQLNQRNNIHVTYRLDGENEILLRLEMLSGVTVMGQAKKCQEFLDRLRTHGIWEKLQPTAAPQGSPRDSGDDIPTQIEKLASLKNKGILTEAEFAQKKSELLAKM